MKYLRDASMLALVLLLIPVSAAAEDLYFDPYVGAGFGQFQLATGSSSASTPGGFVLLGAEINPYVCPEIRFGKAGKGSTNGYSRVALDWFASYLLRLQAPVNEDASLYGLAGGTTMRTSLTPTAGSKLSDTSTTFTFGVGIDYKPWRHVSVGAEWVRYGRGYKSSSNRGLNVTGITGLVKYSF